VKHVRSEGRRLGGWWVLPVLIVTTSSCGTRMDRVSIQAAERGGLVVGTGQRPVGSASTATGAGGSAVSSEPGWPSGAGASSVAGAAGTAAPAAGSSAPSPRVEESAPAAARGGGGGKAAAGSPAGAARSAPSPANGMPGSGQAAAAAAPAGTGTKKAVAIGSVATLSGPLGAFTKDYIFAIGVWAKWTNGRGGVNGHPVRHLIADDGGDPARYNATLRQMVEEQGVIAFVHNTIGFAGGDLSYVTQRQVPIIGHEGGTDAGYASPFVFTPAPSGSTYAYSAISSLASVLVPAGKTKLAVMACSDVKLCDTFDKVYMSSAKELGFEVVYHARPSLTQPDFTGECLSARQAGAQAMLVSLDNNSALRVGRSCTRQNYQPVFGLLDNVIVPSVADDPVMEGAVIATKAPAWPATDVPGLAEIHGAFASAAPGVEVDGAHVNGWVSAKAFEVAARNLPDNPTSGDVLQGLWSIDRDDLGGLTYPLSFPKMQNSPKKACWSAVQIRQRKFVPAKESTLICK
jgi:ABC-type branched-subunit amino acid transport system substrate-binding protein